MYKGVEHLSKVIGLNTRAERLPGAVTLESILEML